MKREIKFRVWTGKEMIVSEAGLNGSNGFITLIEFQTNCVDSRDSMEYEFQQFTGLKDKNGKEIYEGDIVKREFGVGYESNQYPSFASKTQKESFFVVEWSLAEAGWKGLSEPKDCNFIAEIEVIGNIYENPELLEVSNDL